MTMTIQYYNSKMLPQISTILRNREAIFWDFKGIVLIIYFKGVKIVIGECYLQLFDHPDDKICKKRIE